VVRNLVTTCSPANCPPKCSALGHKRTYAVQNGMSALHPIASAKADFRARSCPLYPPKADMCSALAHVCFGPKADIK